MSECVGDGSSWTGITSFSHFRHPFIITFTFPSRREKVITARGWKREGERARDEGREKGEEGVKMEGGREGREGGREGERRSGHYVGCR